MALTESPLNELFRENTIISKSAAFVPSVASTVMHSRRDPHSHSSSRSRHVLVGHGCSLDDSVRRGLRRVDICVCVCVCGGVVWMWTTGHTSEAAGGEERTGHPAAPADGCRAGGGSGGTCQPAKARLSLLSTYVVWERPAGVAVLVRKCTEGRRSLWLIDVDAGVRYDSVCVCVCVCV